MPNTYTFCNFPTSEEPKTLPSGSYYNLLEQIHLSQVPFETSNMFTRVVILKPSDFTEEIVGTTHYYWLTIPQNMCFVPTDVALSVSAFDTEWHYFYDSTMTAYKDAIRLQASATDWSGYTKIVLRITHKSSLHNQSYVVTDRSFIDYTQSQLPIDSKVKVLTQYPDPLYFNVQFIVDPNDTRYEGYYDTIIECGMPFVETFKMPYGAKIQVMCNGQDITDTCEIYVNGVNSYINIVPIYGNTMIYLS